MSDYPACERKIGANLAFHRNRLRISQADLARHLDIDRPTLSAIEHGRRRLRFSEAIVLAERHNISLDYLADGTPIAY